MEFEVFEILTFDFVCVSGICEGEIGLWDRIDKENVKLWIE